MKTTSLLILCFFATSVHTNGAIVHQYTFNDGSAYDHVGGAHGVLHGAAKIEGGRLHLDGGEDPNDPNSVAYVDLPNGIVGDLVTAGSPFGISFEVWVTVDSNRDWASIFGFASGRGLEDDDFFASHPDNWYVQLIPQAYNQLRSEIGCFGCGPYDPRSFGYDDNPLAAGKETHAVVTLEVDPKYRLGRRHQGSISSSVFIDGQLVDTVAPTDWFHRFISLPSEIIALANSNNWLGRSVFPGEPYFDGSYDEFRIHNVALTAEDVAASFATGPTPVPEPSAFLLLLIVVGTCSIGWRRSRR